MNSRLVFGIPKEEFEKVKDQLNTLLHDPCMDYVRRALRLMNKKMSSPDYDTPSWAYKQAHQNGYNQAIEDVLKLIATKE